MTDHITWSVEHRGVELHWDIDVGRLPHRIALLRDSAGPHLDGLDNFLHRHCHALAVGFEQPPSSELLIGLAYDVLLAVALRKHPEWFENRGCVPILHFSIDPGVPLEVAALQPSSIAISSL